jgi:hypothetical protein
LKVTRKKEKKNTTNPRLSLSLLFFSLSFALRRQELKKQLSICPPMSTLSLATRTFPAFVFEPLTSSLRDCEEEGVKSWTLEAERDGFEWPPLVTADDDDDEERRIGAAAARACVASCFF